MLNTAKYPMIPERTLNSLVLYVEHGTSIGDFLYAVLSNDLVESVNCADTENAQVLSDIVRFVYNEIPSAAWGNPNKVNAWMAKAANRYNSIQYKEEV